MDRVRSLILPAAALVFGVLGGLLRKLELASVYDAAGLPVSGHPITIAMAILSGLFAVILVLGSVLIIKPAGGYEVYFPGCTGSSLIHTASGAILAVSSVLGVLTAQGDMFRSVTLYLLVLAGLCICCHGVFCLAKKDGQPPSALLLIPVFCMCIKLIYVFKGWSVDPAIVDYIYELLAVIFITLSLFFTCGFLFDECRPRLTAAVSLVGVYFAVLTAMVSGSAEQMLFFAFAALYMLAISLRMIGTKNGGNPA
ncbi:MAG: hypothetical protein E7430_06260 [Ruminococcaceae bacterium]|nr:hypothetical protein [Oscillospiraceae bacterium]